MKKIYFIFALLPFSLFAELNKDDLMTIEYELGKIQEDISTIESHVGDSSSHLHYIRQICAEILSTLTTAAIGSQLEDIRTKLNGISNRSQTIIDKLNEFLPEIKNNLQSANTNLFNIQTEISYLYNLVEGFKDETFDLLTSIDYKLTDIKTAITDGFENLNTAMSSLQESITTISTKFDELNTTTQNIYTELISQGYDVKQIISILTTKIMQSPSRYYSVVGSMSAAQNIGIPYVYDFQYKHNIGQSTNFVKTIVSVLENIEYLDAEVNQQLANQIVRMYDIQTNFYSSIKIQKDISTNVAYIASVITNSHDLLKLIASNVVKIARHTMPTNVADQYETQQQEQIDQISSNYQEHENDMSAYESSLTHIPSKIQKPLDDGVDYISRLNSPSTFEVNTLDDDIYACLPDYHSSLANMSFSLPIDIKLTPDLKQILSIVRKCVTTTIWLFTFLFSLFIIQKFLQFVLWIMSLLQPTTRDVFGNTSSGSLYCVMGG